MSYILEALRKADAERERGAVPDIHTQPLFANDREPATRSRWLVPVLGVTTVALVAALAFVLLRGRDDGVRVAQAPQAATGNVMTPAAPGGATAPGSSPAPAAAPVTTPGASGSAPGAVTAPPATATSSAPAPSAAAPQRPAASAPAASAPREPATRSASRATAPPASPSRATTGSARDSAAQDAGSRTAAASRRDDVRAPSGTAASSAAAADSGAGRVYAINELPDDVRRSLPNFTFGGSVYSDTPANRMLIINGLLFNEGGQPAPDVVLDQIRLKSAVFRYRGYRYEVPY